MTRLPITVNLPPVPPPTRAYSLVQAAQLVVVVASLLWFAWTLAVSEARQDAREAESALRRTQVIAENRQSIADRAKIARDLDRIAERLERLLPHPQAEPGAVRPPGRDPR